MAKLVDIAIKPGLCTIPTARGAEGRWKNGNRVRFWKGLVQKIGGWSEVDSNIAFAGKARAALDWRSLDFESIIALGTHLKLYVWCGGTFYDITPLRESGTLGNNPFTTTNTSTAVSVADTSHGLTAGDYVHYSGATAVGGITISGEYTVTSVTSANAYAITHSSAATSTATGGGAAVAYQYEIATGGESSSVGLGWGAGTYGSGTYGTARTVSSLLQMARIWSLDNWGEDLIACPRGGKVYVWDTSAGFGTRATLITNAPSTVKAIFVYPENRYLVALGAHDGSADDPLLVRWTTSEDYTDWTPGTTDTAGDKRLDHGNEIYCALKMFGEVVIFTDAALYSMVFTGDDFVFNFQYRGMNGGMVGPNAAKDFNSVAYWMGARNFYYYDGQIHVLDCDVLNHVFEDFNWQQRAKVWAGANREFTEVWWLYPTAASTECDAYVVFNTEEKHWSFGTLARTVLVGDSDTIADPYGCGTDGILYTHEDGVNDVDDALSASVESGDLDIGDGEYLMRVRKVVPDFKRLEGSVSLTLNGKKYPGSTETLSSATQEIRSTTKYANPKLKARQISISLSCSAADDDFSMGTLRLELVPHGKR